MNILSHPGQVSLIEINSKQITGLTTQLFRKSCNPIAVSSSDCTMWFERGVKETIWEPGEMLSHALDLILKQLPPRMSHD